MPLQQGNVVSALIPWHTDPRLNRIRTGAKWQLTIDITDPTPAAAPIAVRAPAECPPQIERRYCPARRQVNRRRLVQASAGCDSRVYSAGLPVCRRAGTCADGESASHVSAACGSWMPARQPEPVAAFVETSAALVPALIRRLPRLAHDLEYRWAATVSYDGWMPAPGPEPVAAFVQASVAVAPSAMLRLPRLAAGFEATPDTPAACDRWIPAPGPEPVAAWVHTCAAQTPAYCLRLPRLAAELEATPFIDLALDTPAICERWTPCPGPEPVAAFVQPSVALAPAAHALRIPNLAAGLEPASIPDLAAFAQAPGPEPVAACRPSGSCSGPGTLRKHHPAGPGNGAFAAPGCAPRVVQPLCTG